MNLYRQSITLFGLILPIVIAGAVIGGSYYLKSQMDAIYADKHSNYKTYESSRLAGLDLERQVNHENPHLTRWSGQLSTETASTFTTTFRDIIEHLPTKEIQQTAFEPSASKGGFGTVSAQKSSQLRIAFRGTYRTMQRAFLELETRMPQLQLQDLKIDPSTSQSSLLNFQVNYTAWEN
jgi:hypothetical protein